MRCSLPIDWLEYLEGAHSEELASHITGCLPCQLLVEELRRETRPQLRSSGVPNSDTWPRWTESKPALPSFGDICWTADSLTAMHPNATRALLIVVSDVWEEEDHFWYDVVPLTSDIGHRTSDIEDATSLDLLLVRANTTLEVPGRMLLRYQAVADVHGLGSRVGTLTATGRAIVKDALAGCAPGQRFGTPVEGESDPRVRISDELDLTIRLINQHYAQVMETDNISKRPGRVLSFPMHTISINSAVGKTNSNLAVASHTEQEMNHWIVKIPERGSIRGRIEYEYSTDELFFAVEEVGEQLGLQTTAWIVVWADRHDTPAESQHFHPTIDQRIVIARDFAFPQEITRLEMRLLIDEA